MSRSNYKISEQAIIDSNEIWTFTFQKWSKSQADSYYSLIIEEIEFIAANPVSGKSFEQRRKNYRYRKVESHLIFY